MKLTFGELLSIGERILSGSGIYCATHETEALLCFATGLERHQLLLNRSRDVDNAQINYFLSLVRRRKSGEPLQYITGEQYFMGHRLAVDPSVLIPRPETETLAEKAISCIRTFIGESSDALNILDLCTGSGALAISIAKACPHVKITAADISKQALKIAKKNALDLGLANRIDFIESDLFANISRSPGAGEAFEASGGSYHLIVTNPPYIRSGDLADLQREIKNHEPLTALDGGADGLVFYRRIASEASEYLAEHGVLLTEIGYDQARDVIKILETAGFTDIELFRDLIGHDRIIKARSGRVYHSLA